MRQFQQDIERINEMVGELENDLERTTHRVVQCIEQLDELSGRIAQASKVLREQAIQQRVNSLAAASQLRH